MITASNVTVQFGEKPLFEDVSVKFGDGHRYGLIGANGSGKTTFMKVLGGELEPTYGNVSIGAHLRVGKLRQDQFAFEEFSVIHTVIMGHEKLWNVFQERERLYAQPSMTEAEGLRAAELESEFAQLDGYSAEAAAGELLLAVGIPVEQHYGPMSAVAPGWKLRVLLAQALVRRPGHHVARRADQQPRHRRDPLARRRAERAQVHDDHHLARPPLPELSVCTHMADMDYGELRVFPGNYDDYMIAATQAREQQLAERQRARPRSASPISKTSCAASRRTSRRRGRRPRARKQIEKIKLEEVKPSSRQNPFISFDATRRSCIAWP